MEETNMLEMNTLPIGSTINGCEVFHEGNHGNDGNPHMQYLSSSHFNKTVNNGDQINKSFKLFEVNWLGDHNYSLFYELDMYVNLYAKSYKIYLKIQNGNIQNFSYDDNGAVFLRATLEDLGYPKNDPYHKQFKLTVYGHVFGGYRTANLRLNKAILNKPVKGATEFILQDDYAFKCITFFKDSPLIDVVTGNVTIEANGQNKVDITTWGQFSIGANGRYTIRRKVENVRYGCVPQFSFNQQLPLGVVTGASGYNVDTSEIYIDLYNITASAITVPAMTISWAILNSF